MEKAGVFPVSNSSQDANSQKKSMSAKDKSIFSVIIVNRKISERKMIKIRSNKTLIIIALIAVFAIKAQAQISANADAFMSTNYSGGMKQDQIFIFCGNKGATNASLQVSTNMGGDISYGWQKYDASVGVFQPYAGGNSQRISSLENGGYRVVVSNGTQTETYTAWVFNNYYEVSAEITESNCNYFQLEGAFDSPTLTYYDLATGQPKEIDKNIEFQWKEGNASIASVKSPKIYDPPTRNTRYSLHVTDRFGCSGDAEVTYTSIVTKASFSVSEQKGEAPLKVDFANESENGKPGSYEWFFFKDLDVIKEESKSGGVVDSIDFIAYNDELSYTFENSGTYMVKLVSKHISDLHTCTDTFYLEDYIVADTSFVKAPNFFTPNGDGANDEFVVKFWSVKNIKISIFNRWGKQVHVWDGSNIQGFENTVSSVTESVWDGKIGGKMASPGVYYYVVEARGRDGKNRWAHGFVHLFREK